MRRSYTKLFIVTAAVLVNLTWLADNISYRAELERAERVRNEWRVRAADMWLRYECEPLYKIGCSPDFDGDGATDHLYLDRFPAYSDRWLVADVGEYEALRVVYTEGTRTETRTRVALPKVRGRSRLLVYDPVSYAEPLLAVFEWDGKRLARAEPLVGEQAMLDFVAERDGLRRSWDAATERFRRVRVGIYFVTLSGLLGVALYWRLSARQRLP